ncbi:MAG: hypothetical protein ACR2HJ_10840 [Fimbriimonadales bacterium]
MRILLVNLLFVTTQGALPHNELWYGGDFDGRGFLESGKNTAIEDARVYDNFFVEGPGYDIQYLFGNFLVAGPLPTQLYYEFRRNMGPGDGGKLLHSGTVAATNTATGRSGWGMTEWRVSGDMPEIELEQGHYWLTVAPVGNGTGNFYLSTTSGANSIGFPIGDGNSFYDQRSVSLRHSPLPGGYTEPNFDPTSEWLGIEKWDFSQGFGNNYWGARTRDALGHALRAWFACSPQAKMRLARRSIPGRLSEA